MRHPIGFFALFLAPPARRTTSCGHCGDSFTGDLAHGRAWLAEHSASERLGPAPAAESRAGRVVPARLPLPAATLSASTSQP
jgi:hypothetical protein